MMLFPRKLKNEIYKKSTQRHLNAAGGYSYLYNDGVVHLLVEPSVGSSPVIACCRSLSSVALGDALVFTLFMSRAPQCRQCLDHFYASQFSKNRDAKLSSVVQQQTKKFNDDNLASLLLFKVLINLVRGSANDC